jgi:acyl dehydratase
MSKRDVIFDTVKIGDTAIFSVTITEALVNTFAELSGDFNPLHCNEEFAKATPFGRRVAHGMLLGAFISQLVGMHLPGTYCVYVQQNLNFRQPVFIGDTVEVKGCVLRKIDSTKMVEIETTIVREKSIVVDGRALVLVSR